MIKFFEKLCLPSLIYFILAIVQIAASILFGMATVSTFISGIIILVLWTWLLNYICKAGYEVLSWILVFVPILFTILAILFLANFMKNLSPEDKKEMMDEIKKKSA